MFVLFYVIWHIFLEIPNERLEHTQTKIHTNIQPWRNPPTIPGTYDANRRIVLTHIYLKRQTLKNLTITLTLTWTTLTLTLTLALNIMQVRVKYIDVFESCSGVTLICFQLKRKKGKFISKWLSERKAAFIIAFQYYNIRLAVLNGRKRWLPALDVYNNRPLGKTRTHSSPHGNLLASGGPNSSDRTVRNNYRGCISGRTRITALSRSV